MANRFQSLGIPFPLFEAPVAEASDYHGEAACVICRQRATHCFTLGIGDNLFLPCPSCHALNSLDADDRQDTLCRACGHVVPFPPISDPMVAICYACLRAGHGAITKDTELGIISWEQTLTGVTHGAPGLDHNDFPLVPLEDGWVGARLAPEYMLELLRTPTYSSWQGERWLFCCRAPMVYLGGWSQDEFSRHAPDGDGEAFFYRIVDSGFPGLWDFDPDVVGIYVFRCQTCGRFDAYWDAT